jgi:hypothetical protein
MNASTLDDERRDISALVVQFLKKVGFGRDFERTLDFLMNARGAFRCVAFIHPFARIVDYSQQLGRRAANACSKRELPHDADIPPGQGQAFTQDCRVHSLLCFVQLHHHSVHCRSFF